MFKGSVKSVIWFILNNYFMRASASCVLETQVKQNNNSKIVIIKQ